MCIRDSLWSVDPLIDRQIHGAPGVVLREPDGYCAQHGMAFNQTKPPFTEVAVRRAVSAGINRREIIASVLRGRGAITTKIPPCDAPFGYSGDDKGLPYYAHDPALSRRLLAEAGFANGLDTTLEAVSYTHLRAHETPEHLVCRLLLEKKK